MKPRNEPSRKAANGAPTPAVKGHAASSGGGRNGAPMAAWREWPWLFCLALFAATVAAYWPALHGGFIWGDQTPIAGNAFLRAPAGLLDIWFKPAATFRFLHYSPLSFTVFWVEWHIWNSWTPGYHLINIFLHAGAAILLWQVLERLKVRGAWLAGAIFALHPVCVMSVAWMAQLKNTLSVALALGATWAWLRAIHLGVYEQGEDTRVEWRSYALSLVLFLLALLAKTTVSVLPFTLLLLVWWRGRRLSGRDVWLVAPMFACAVAMGVATFIWTRAATVASDAAQLGFADRILVSGRSFWFYLEKVFWPHPLSFIYGRWQVESGAWWQWAFPITTVVALAAAWSLRVRIGRGLFAALAHFYVSTSVLALAFSFYMMRYSRVSDHWQYLGLISIVAVTASAIMFLLEKVSGSIPTVKYAACGALLVGLSVLTWRQCGNYSDIQTLWAATIAQNPGASRALSDDPGAEEYLGNLLVQASRLAEAEPHLQRAVELQPGDSDNHYNYANLLLKENRVDDAIKEYRLDLGINPRDALGHANLGNALLAENKLAEGVEECRRSVSLMTNNAMAHAIYGRALLLQGQLLPAVDEFKRALAIQPDFYQAESQLLAIAWIWATHPDKTYRSGVMAVKLMQDLKKTGGTDPSLLGTLAAAEAEVGDFQAARENGETALQLATARNNQGLATKLQEQLGFYRSNQPYRDASLTNVFSSR